MEFNDVIRRRKSVRSFSTREVSEEAIGNIINCGARAPAACNLRAFHFERVTDLAVKEKIVSTTYKGSHPGARECQEWIEKAPVILLVIAALSEYEDKFGKDYQKDLYLNASACVENMLLKAVDLGLASCYVTGFREEELKRKLDIPKDYEVIALLPLGYEYELETGGK